MEHCMGLIERTPCRINTRQVGLPTQKGEYSTNCYLENTKYN